VVGTAAAESWLFAMAAAAMATAAAAMATAAAAMAAAGSWRVQCLYNLV